MLVLRNVHTIWVSYNGCIPDQVVSNLIAWREMLPGNWDLYLWTNRSEINEQYLAYLSNYCTVLDVQDIIDKTPKNLQDKLNFFLLNGFKLDFLFARTFSDIFRLLLMAIEDAQQRFSGIYIDAGDTFFTGNTRSKLKNFELPHGFAFRIELKEFDSNVTIFSPISAYNSEMSPACQILAAYFYRLANWQVKHFQKIKDGWKFSAITNIKKLFGYNYTTSRVITMSGHEFPIEEINATSLLNLECNHSGRVLAKYDKHKLTYNSFSKISKYSPISSELKSPAISQYTCKIPHYTGHHPIPFSDPAAEI
jgi:hypothetical protein